MFEKNLVGKFRDAQFNADMSALLRPGVEWRAEDAAGRVFERLLSLRPGDPSWKGRNENMKPNDTGTLDALQFQYRSRHDKCGHVET